MRISGQKDKIKKAFESNSKSITIRFKFSDLYNEDVIALTKSQVDRLMEAYEMRISEGQKDKIKKAFESNSKSITIRFKFSDLYGEDVTALTKSQV